MAMTNAVMKLVRFLLIKSNMALERKRLIWTVCTCAFRGSFRVHELLSRREDEFDPLTTLLGSDVNLCKVVIDGVTENVLKVSLKHPKEDTLGKGVVVELFSTDTCDCPVAAWKKWRVVSKVAMSRVGPVFRLPSGACYTGNQFNKDIKSLLSPHINYDEKRFLSHSFRAGMASMMAAAGYQGTFVINLQ